MEILSDFSLKTYNTFGIDVKAKWFVSVSNIDELNKVLLSNTEKPKFIIGGGSNMLLTKNIEALVIHINLKGIKIIDENADYVLIECMAGENWHQFVLWTLEHDFGGLENLSLIPGNVGSAPIQNIGAYGVELKDSFIRCNAIEINTGKQEVFDKETCRFGYRESIFKNECKDKFIITSVVFKLSKHSHKLNTSYGNINTELEKNKISNPTIQDISNVVTAIRQNKLPNPKILGNSGSFFKNPVISVSEFKSVLEKYPDIPHYIVSDSEVKIPAGWLIEQSGFKGIRIGDAGVHEKQALVLVNHGKASGEELWDLAKKIQKTVLEKFEINVETEVNIF